MEICGSINRQLKYLMHFDQILSDGPTQTYERNGGKVGEKQYGVLKQFHKETRDGYGGQGT